MIKKKSEGLNNIQLIDVMFLASIIIYTFVFLINNDSFTFVF